MTERICAVPDCDRRHSARGFCRFHYVRWSRHGDPLVSLAPIADPVERFWAQVDKSGDCWLWTAALSGGYGKVTINRRHMKAHRLSYEWTYGPIPDGLEIDHMCHTRACVRPDHLQAVTPQLNQENRTGARRDNPTGYRGVLLERRTGRYRAVARRNHRTHTAGTFDTPEEAAAAAAALRNRLMTNNLRDREAS
jgi:hypothetical protein